MFSLLPCPTLSKQSILVCGYDVKGVLVVQGTVPCQVHWHKVYAIKGGAGVHTR
jgi:hypothetical protein